jgi:hypothetical protein
MDCLFDYNSVGHQRERWMRRDFSRRTVNSANELRRKSFIQFEFVVLRCSVLNPHRLSTYPKFLFCIRNQKMKGQFCA